MSLNQTSSRSEGESIQERGGLTREEEMALPTHMQAGGEKQKRAFERVIQANQGLVMQMVRKYFREGMDKRDLVSAGNTGLMEAAMRFDPSRGFRFMTFAIHYVRNEVQEAARLSTGAIIFTKREGEAQMKHRLLRNRGENPTAEQLAKASGQSPDGEVIQTVLRMPEIHFATGDERGEAVDRCPAPEQANPEEAFAVAQVGAIVRRALTGLEVQTPLAIALKNTLLRELETGDPTPLATLAEQGDRSRQAASFARREIYTKLRKALAGKDVDLF